MATRGTKPKPAHLRLIDGTHRPARHGARAKARKDVAKSIVAFGPLRRPTYLKGEARAAWDRYIKPAGWLDGSREPAAIAFCILWAQFREFPAAFLAAKHSQMRAYMSELGLIEERKRLSVEPEEPDEFFGD
jgi:phage terminase small subunit